MYLGWGLSEGQGASMPSPSGARVCHPPGTSVCSPTWTPHWALGSRVFIIRTSLACLIKSLAFPGGRAFCALFSLTGDHLQSLSRVPPRVIKIIIIIFWLLPETCGILVLRPGSESGPSAVRARSPNHWTTREFPRVILLTSQRHSCHSGNPRVFEAPCQELGSETRYMLYYTSQV